MKKIMFNDRYGLTQAVLNGRKTMIRRIATELNHPNITDISEWGVDNKGKVMLAITYDIGLQEDVYPHFQIGEIVAVAQRYKDIYPNADFEMVGKQFITESAGWNNKMFVRADLMRLFICIADIKAERLQDITEEDCMKEGVQCLDTPDGKKYVPGGFNVPERDRKLLIEDKAELCDYFSFDSEREAFAALIDRISGRGTWERNPWVFAYEFELVK